MAWDTVPWFVGGGAQHSPEVARLLAYASTAGAEGIAEPGDLKVVPLDVPGSAVRVNPGAALIRNRATGGGQQTYVARLPSADTVSIAPTGSGGGRSDLIVARIEDPYMAGEPWQDPADPTVGPYVFTRVVSNVPSTTKSAAELGLGHSMIALARIDLPASTGTVEASHIVDLRQQAVPFTRVEPYLPYYPPKNGTIQELTSSSFVTWPTGAEWWVDVPEWAVRMEAMAVVAGVAHYGGVGDYFVGGLRVHLGTYGAQYRIYSGTSELDGVYKHRQDYSIPCSMDIIPEFRGTRQRVSIQGARTEHTGTGRLVADYQTSALLSITWVSGAD